MKAILQTNQYKDLVIERNELSFTDKYDQYSEKYYDLNYHQISGKMKQQIFNDFLIERRHVSLGSDLQIDIEHHKPMLKMHFEIKGYSEFKSLNRSSVDTTIEEGNHQLFYFPYTKGKLYYLEGKNRETLEVLLTEDFLKQNIPAAISNKYQEMMHAIKSNKIFILSEKQLKISSKMLMVIHDILSTDANTVLNRFFISNKVIELFILQLKQIEKSIKQISDIRLSKRDIESLNFLKEYLDQNFSKKFTLESLAKLIGVNTSKLKYGYKELFNSSVFSYIRGKRMEKAKQMLSSLDHSVSEVSFLSGYKNPQHFSAAFKKHFGFPPSNLKKD